MQYVQDIRQFNRFYVQNIGIFKEDYLAGAYSLLSVRVLFEISTNVEWTAADIVNLLKIDAGYLSRILRTLEKRGVIQRTASKEDARRKNLSITPFGEEELAQLQTIANNAVLSMTEGLKGVQLDYLVDSMKNIESIIKRERPETIDFREPFPGELGMMIQRHGELYPKEFGWDHTFEIEAGEVFSAFFKNRDRHKEKVWIADIEGQFAGCIFLVKINNETARLRALLVEPKFRGHQIGKKLVNQCKQFAKTSGYKEIVLWTCDQLKAARSIYQQAGFQLVDTKKEVRWGLDINGEDWRLTL